MNAEYAFSYYTAKGVPAHVAAAIVGNLAVESANFSPSVIAGTKKGDNGKAYYVGQWRGSRKTNFENYAARTGRDPSDLDAQLDFVLEEMNPKSAYRDPIAAKNRDKIMNATTVEEATSAFAKHHSRAGTPHLSRREAVATSLSSPTLASAPAQIVPDLQPISNPYASAVPARSVQTVSLPDMMAPPSFRPETPVAPTAPVNPLGVGGTLAFNHPWQNDLTPSMKDALTGTSAEFGAPLSVISGSRPAAYNARVGGARNSYHIGGRAADISMAGMSPAQRQSLVQNLAQRGAGGFITYSKTPDMLHVDMRARPGGQPHFMHDRSARNMSRAPGWFQDMAAAGGIKTPDRMAAPLSRPTDTMMAQAPTMAPTAMAALGAPASGSGRVAMDVPAAPGPFSMAAQAAPAPAVPGVLTDRMPNLTSGLPAALPDRAPDLAAGRPQAYPDRMPNLTAWAPSPARPDNLDYRGPTFSQAAPALPPARSIEDRPIAAIPESVPITVPPSMLTPPTVTPPAITPPGTFPAAPPAPGRQTMRDAALGGARGIMGGPVGMIAGAIAGPAIGQIGRNIAHNRRNPNNRINPLFGVSARYRGLGLPSFGGLLTGIPAPNYNAPQYSVGSGYGAIGSVFGAPAGAMARSRSNPEIGFMSLGNGYVSRTNDRYGTTQTMAPGDYDAGIFGGKTDSGKGGKK